MPATDERRTAGGSEPTELPPLCAHPYAAFLTALEKPARYLGAEHGSVRKSWERARARICLAFPDRYEVGMSHLGYRILQHVANTHPELLAERCYGPWHDLERELRARGLPLVSLESARPLSDFDVVGFSLQYELTYTNVLTMLELGGLPLRACERGDDVPLVLGGGPTASHPEPMADFFDAFVLGDGEDKLPEVALCWAELGRRGVARRAKLEALAALGSVYVPSLYRTERDPATGLEVVQEPLSPHAPARVVGARADLERHRFPHDGPIAGTEAVFDRVSIELARGCRQGCRFCQAGMTYRPVRERSVAQVLAVARAAARHSGSDELSLTALSPADVATLQTIAAELGPELASCGVALAVSSLRAYGLAPDLLDELHRLRAAGLTFAPEAGTQRLRDVINKNVSEEQLGAATELAASRGWTRLKLYFMIGLPTESDDDVRAIVATAARIAAIARRAAKRRVEVTVSVSTHVPKPHTPLQWVGADALGEIERKQELLRAAVRSERALKLRVHHARTTVLEAALARGDRRLGRVIEAAWRAGARFDAWDEELRYELWEQAFAGAGLDLPAGLRPLPLGALLPWSHLGAGVDEGFLRREHRRALAARPSPLCGRPAPLRGGRQGPRDVCYQCGAGCAPIAQHAHGEAPSPQARPPSDTPVLEPLARVGTRDQAVRARLLYRKLGPAALLGHLDLVRELPRVFRRAGARLVYTSGFHPKPAMSFGPALSLGVPSLGELCDVRLASGPGAAELTALCAALDAVAPEGLRFVSARMLGPTEPAAARLAVAARYLVLLGRQAPDGARLAATVAEAMGRPHALVRRLVKGQERLVDLRPSILDAAVAAPDEREALRELGWPQDLPTLRVDVALDASPPARPTELAAVLLGPPVLHPGELADAEATGGSGGHTGPEHRVVRAALLGLTDGLLRPIGACANASLPI